MGGDFSDGELAFSSFDKPLKSFTFCNKYPGKIHPTEKPIELYKWLLKNYAKEGDKILDTHAGSFSSAIACYDMGFDGVFCEIDKDYYDAGLKRIREHLSQERIFEKPAELIENVKLF